MSTGTLILLLVAGAFIFIILGVPVYASLGLIGTVSLEQFSEIAIREEIW